MAQRAYTSKLRAQKAEETRRAIIETARDLFAEHGYGRVGLATVAAEAGVALNTVYASVGGKPALILAMAKDSADDEQTDHTRQQILATQDGPEILRLTAEGTRVVIERHDKTLTVLMDARNSDADVAKAADFAMSHYRGVLDSIADRLCELGEVRTELSRAQVRGVLWFYFGASAWTTSVRELGWSYEEASSWLQHQAAAALLGRPDT
ncbi:TetR/AcrR family transcriptional regulator [Streptomyces longispororuber]|uniref:TetR/AcrR family transcriptional regulator n=1 Tax=Streptomyces longispororuber TaxID=68230 RepID=UPI002108991A|nr:TetR/AcrR family transcriptional regulator [Streptomyces longispororuber]MCQ4212812.1 TetR/AcrR family transcriptional regulator [Streptomyces longispororuber]